MGIGKNSRLAHTYASELGKAEGSATEADYRASLTGSVTGSYSHDPYNGTLPELSQQVKRTDLRELSRQIRLRRAKADQTGQR